MNEVEMQDLLEGDFLRVPTLILQMQRVLKNGSHYACLQFIWAKTGGWKNLSDTISYSQFRDDKRYGTGLSTKTIQRSVEKLADMGVISVVPSFNNMHEFTLNIPKIKELVEAQAKSICPSLKKPSQVNLSTSQDNLSTSQVNLSYKHGQFVLHTRPFTQDYYIRLNTLKEEGVNCEKIYQDSLAKTLLEKWCELSGRSERLTEKRKGHFRARLSDGFTVSQIIEAMQFVATDTWHVSKGFNSIDLVIRSTEQLEKKLNQATANKSRLGDKLAVNSNWENATQSAAAVAPTITYEQLMESMQ